VYSLIDIIFTRTLTIVKKQHLISFTFLLQENWPKSAIEYAEFLLVNLKDAIAVECDENTMTKDSTNKVNLLLLVFFCYGLQDYLVCFFSFC